MDTHWDQVLLKNSMFFAASVSVFLKKCPRLMHGNTCPQIFSLEFHLKSLLHNSSAPSWENSCLPPSLNRWNDPQFWFHSILFARENSRYLVSKAHEAGFQLTALTTCTSYTYQRLCSWIICFPVLSKATWGVRFNKWTFQWVVLEVWSRNWLAAPASIENLLVSASSWTHPRPTTAPDWDSGGGAQALMFK